MVLDRIEAARVGIVKWPRAGPIAVVEDAQLCLGAGLGFLIPKKPILVRVHRGLVCGHRGQGTAGKLAKLRWIDGASLLNQ